MIPRSVQNKQKKTPWHDDIKPLWKEEEIPPLIACYYSAMIREVILQRREQRIPGNLSE
jgi:hypothetical protein